MGSPPPVSIGCRAASSHQRSRGGNLANQFFIMFISWVLPPPCNSHKGSPPFPPYTQKPQSFWWNFFSRKKNTNHTTKKTKKHKSYHKKNTKKHKSYHKKNTKKHKSYHKKNHKKNHKSYHKKKTQKKHKSYHKKKAQKIIKFCKKLGFALHREVSCYSVSFSL